MRWNKDFTDLSSELASGLLDAELAEKANDNNFSKSEVVPC